MGGELGIRVAQLLEAEPRYTEIVGIDIDPPRRRLRRARFHRVHPAERDEIVDVIRAVDPQVVVHLGVYEPDARATPSSAARRTREGAIAVLGAAAQCPSLEHIVMRSGVEIYGRRRGAPMRPDEGCPTDPTTPFGVSLAAAERLATEAGQSAGVSVTRLRFSPVVGAHFPSPLGRLLRQPVVPFDPVADAPFALVHTEDAARAVVRAVRTRVDAPVNVGGRGVVSSFQAIRMGERIPVPVTSLAWQLAPALSSMFGAPIPPHVIELLRRGRCADVSSCAGLLGAEPELTTVEVVKELFDWATVTTLPAVEAVA